MLHPLLEIFFFNHLFMLISKYGDIDFIHCTFILWVLVLMAQMVKNLSAMNETQVQSLGQEDPLEKNMATHSCSTSWRIPWTEKPSGLQSTGLQGVRHS